MKKKYILGMCCLVSSIFLSSCGTGSATVTSSPSEIILSSNGIEVSVDDTEQITYTVMPEANSGMSVKWESMDESVASVDSTGLVTGISVGETTIIVSCEDGGYTSCPVVVTKKSAYDQLDTDCRDLVDKLIAVIDEFYDPSSVSLSYAYLSANGSWDITVRAHNQTGGYSEQDYYLNPDGSIETPIFNHVKIESIEDLDLVNEAIQEIVSE